MAKFSSAPSLLLGISARIFIDKFILNNDSPLRDFGLLGLWQGVAVYYAFTINHDLALALALVLAAKLLIDFASEHDITKFTSTILAAALGIVITDVLSRFLGDGLYHAYRAQHRTPTAKSHAPRAEHDKKRPRAVHFDRNGTADPVREGTTTTTTTTNNNTRPTHHGHRPPRRPTQSDITSLDSTSDFIGPQSSSLSPLDREVARLRARASLADTERRRYKEERKWAISQGNHARASQMTWEVKRYKALMQSFHREADALVIHASNTRQNGTDAQRSPAQERSSRSKPNDSPTDRQPGLAIGESSNHRKQKSGR